MQFDRRRGSFVVGGVNILAVLLLASAIITAEAQAQWTQYGGPGQSFTAESTGLAKEWPAQGPPKLWSRTLGEGHSSILADDGRLYTMYRVGNEERAICLDAATGSTLWEYGYESSPAEGHNSDYGNGPNSTPLLADARLYAIGIAGVMHCLDAGNGKELWSRNLWSDFGANHELFGYSSSPIEYKDTVITLVGGPERSIVAFNKSDGSIAWKNLSFDNSYSTPKVLKIHGKDQLVVFMGSEAIGTDPNNGELKWRYPIENRWKQNITAPVLGDDNTLFVSSLLVGSRGLKLAGNADKTDVEEIWTTEKIQIFFSSAVRIGDYVYACTGKQGGFFLACVNIPTGKIVWRKRGFGRSHVVYADGYLIILDEDGNLGLATATPDDLTVHSKFKPLERPSWTPPTIVGKTLYLRDQHKIMALDLG